MEDDATEQGPAELGPGEAAAAGPRPPPSLPNSSSMPAAVCCAAAQELGSSTQGGGGAVATQDSARGAVQSSSLSFSVGSRPAAPAASKTARAASAFKVGGTLGVRWSFPIPLPNSAPFHSSHRHFCPQSSVVNLGAFGGSALLSGVNAITPHLAGAVDIMVVEQPDQTYKCSPFYGLYYCFVRCFAAL